MGCALCTEEIDFSGDVDLSHFSLLRSVGKGAFGKVRVVQHKRTKEVFALKYINKAKCVSMKAVENIIQERRLLEEINCPFVCNLKYAFQDDENLFMVLDLMLGGDLRFHLDLSGPFTEERIRFYAAEIGCALSYLHEKNIVHRDLKPDNIMLDQKGHAHLTDFNIAVRFREGKPMTAVAGSLAYMAPEIVMKKGYYSAVDWWSLGVLLYELLYGKRPFRGKNNEQLTASIISDTVTLVNLFQDRESISQNCTDMISSFLNRDINNRLGAKESGGLEKLMLHPFFASLDWAALSKKALVPPFIPDSKKVNFDATHELEELLLEDNPLTVQRRSNSGPRTLPTGEELPKEYLVLEAKFKLYDYTKAYKADTALPEPADGKGVAATLRKLSMGRTKAYSPKGAAKAVDPPSTINEHKDVESIHRDVMEGREQEVMEAHNAHETSPEDCGTSPTLNPAKDES